MKCLVFSDSHGNSYFIEKALSLHRDAQVVFFLGDGLSDIFELTSKYDKISWLYVRGNCDATSFFFAANAEKIGRITLFDKKIHFTHGDTLGVKYGMEEAEAYCAANGADILLFGHTHMPCERYKDGIYYFNPGSIGSSSTGKFSYGIMMISEKGVLFSHGELSHY